MPDEGSSLPPRGGKGDRARRVLDLSRPAEAPLGEAAAGRIRAIGERLRVAFQEACRAEGLSGHIAGPPEALAVSFEPQDTAEPALIATTLADELRTRGVLAGPVLHANAALTESDVERAVAAIRDAVRRVRTLLVEYNSYLSGGLPWVFPSAPEALAARGLAVYRYPGRAAVEVRAAGDRVRITFQPGPLGEVTSSGFYVPTRLRGDVAATVDYRLRRWVPGPENACLALFAQDEGSMHRYYAQRISSGPDDHRVMANLNERRSEEVAVAGDEGAFRVLRRGRTISSWHRGGGAWTRLGEVTEESAPDLIVGAKIWCGVACGGLEAEMMNLAIAAEVPADQIPVPAVRPDPRAAGA